MSLQTLYLSHSLLSAMALLFTGCLRSSQEPYLTVPGVSLELAQDRAGRISDLSYRLAFNLPATPDSLIVAQVELGFTLKGADRPLAIDFAPPGEQISKVIIDGQAAVVSVDSQHVVIPQELLKEGENSILIEFVAGDQSLNRSADYLYTLLVPDRARTLFPCFDQPDLKARYQLTLIVPPGWTALANGPVIRIDEKDDGSRAFLFAETMPLPTYLFAFTAGRFSVETQERNGRSLTMYYRETDAAKVAVNRDSIFDLHARSLSWLEEFTGIPYPFAKLDFALMPGFQYGGMEHAGCIFYKEPSLILDASATETQRLSRARLIAHETAHMWFGNLVTMRWFNDVWLKEVFANFFAAKAVNPAFPQINHELSFMLGHQPAAYGEDRSGGAHPVRQELENLREAGSLYGGIIYQKAPVVMRQLEALIGEEAFREGLQEYLQTYRYGNATWDDLIAILDERFPGDLEPWSEVWVKQAGMPVLNLKDDAGASGLRTLTLTQESPAANGAFWSQHTTVALVYPDTVHRLPLDIGGKETVLRLPQQLPVPLAIIPNAAAMAYGYFRPDERSKKFFLEKTPALTDPLLRGAAWLTLYEGSLRGDVAPSALLTAIRRALPLEQEPQLRDYLLGTLQRLYWTFTPGDQRLALAPAIENELWGLLEKTTDTGARSAYFRAYRGIALSGPATQRLYGIWSGDMAVANLPLSENDRADLAAAIALRLPARADSVLTRQLEAIANPDRKQRFAFILPALSPQQESRDRFFESLKQPQNRHYEPWVVEAVEYLHHPLRAESSEKYILPSLELMEEIQATGDIFFPRQWITATLSGHRSPGAAQTVRDFLDARPGYPYRLRNKILMAADLLFRVEERGE